MLCEATTSSKAGYFSYRTAEERVTRKIIRLRAMRRMVDEALPRVVAAVCADVSSKNGRPSITPEK